ncbi:MAG: Regulatory protein RecX [Firmicutes bacterium ADurb.Bin456]|nr:MAG: Regulatory protein RecX [Firmicutes bacterium ADurb.Bin456]
MACACRFLTARRRSRKELECYLRRKNYSEDATFLVLEKLEQYGYLDDRTFTRFWVEQRLPKKGFTGLKYELKAKGVEPELIFEIMEELGPDAEYKAALALALKKIKNSGYSCHFTKMARFLQGRGFSSEVIDKICRNLKENGILLTPADLQRRGE